MTDDKQHSLFAPSAAHRWIPCPGSISASKEFPDDDGPSVHRDLGSDAHELSAMCLNNGTDAVAYIGRLMTLGNEVDEQMAAYVQAYVDRCRNEAAECSVSLVETEVDFSNYVQQENQTGTADFIGVKPNRLVVRDLKYGQGVQVFAKDNEQLMLYALGALNEFDMIFDFEDVLLVIDQPRLDHVDEHVVTIDELLGFGLKAATSAAVALSDAPNFNPGEVQCRWCPAKAHCKPLRKYIEELTAKDIRLHEADVDRAELAKAFSELNLVENWCKAVSERVLNELKIGNDVPGFKLVAGRRGARQWDNKEQIEEMMKKSFRLKDEEMYNQTLISPTQAEKLLAKASPRRWARLSPLIVQPEGKPVVAPVSDKRPSINQTGSDFSPIE